MVLKRNSWRNILQLIRFIDSRSVSWLGIKRTFPKSLSAIWKKNHCVFLDVFCSLENLRQQLTLHFSPSGYKNHAKCPRGSSQSRKLPKTLEKLIWTLLKKTDFPSILRVPWGAPLTDREAPLIPNKSISATVCMCIFCIFLGDHLAKCKD